MHMSLWNKPNTSYVTFFLVSKHYEKKKSSFSLSFLNKKAIPNFMSLKQRNISKDSVAKNVNNVVGAVVEEATTLLAAEPASKKWQNWWIRTITTLIMISIFFLILASGYIWSIIMVMIITVLVYREVIHIAYYSAKGNMRWFKSMSW